MGVIGFKVCRQTQRRLSFNVCWAILYTFGNDEAGKRIDDSLTLKRPKITEFQNDFHSILYAKYKNQP